jgi:hypothetical protein
LVGEERLLVIGLIVFPLDTLLFPSFFPRILQILLGNGTSKDFYLGNSYARVHYPIFIISLEISRF